MLPWLLDRGVQPDCRWGRGANTALMQAASDNGLETMRLLLRYGAGPNSRKEESETLLGFACAWKQWAAAGLLLDNGADVNAIESFGEIILDGATNAGDTEDIDLLRSPCDFSRYICDVTISSSANAATAPMMNE